VRSRLELNTNMETEMTRLSIAAITAVVLALGAAGSAEAKILKDMPMRVPMPVPMSAANCDWSGGEMEMEAVDAFIDRHGLRTSQATVERWGGCIKVTLGGETEYYDAKY
jgi:hypothetical protein